MAENGVIGLTVNSGSPQAPAVGYTKLWMDTGGNLQSINSSGSIAPIGGYYPMQGRLTLGSGSPVTTTDITGAGTLYYTPYAGNWHTWFDSGSVAHVTQFSEMSIALSVTSGSVYDVFCVGGSALELLKWSTTSTRATEITRYKGMYTKSGDITRMYIGTICASGTNTCEDSLLNRFVYNYYNRTKHTMFFQESTAHSYSTITARKWNNSDTNNLAKFVLGIPDLFTSDNYYQLTSNAGASKVEVYLDGTNTVERPVCGAGNSTTSAFGYGSQCTMIGQGYHYFQLYEWGASTMSFYLMNAIGIIEC